MTYILTSLEEWELRFSKLTAMTTNNAANIISANKKLVWSFHYLSCLSEFFSHIDLLYNIYTAMNDSNPDVV